MIIIRLKRKTAMAGRLKLKNKLIEPKIKAKVFNRCFLKSVVLIKIRFKKMTKKPAKTLGWGRVAIGGIFSWPKKLISLILKVAEL